MIMLAERVRKISSALAILGIVFRRVRTFEWMDEAFVLPFAHFSHWAHVLTSADDERHMLVMLQ